MTKEWGVIGTLLGTASIVAGLSAFVRKSAELISLRFRGPTELNGLSAQIFGVLLFVAGLIALVKCIPSWWKRREEKTSLFFWLALIWVSILLVASVVAVRMIWPE